MIGHALGAAGAIESVACVLMLLGGYVHPSLNCEDVHPRIAPFAGVDPPRAAAMPGLRTIVKASFGFGDVNACVVFRSGRASAARPWSLEDRKMTEEKILEKVVGILEPYAKDGEALARWRARRTSRGPQGGLRPPVDVVLAFEDAFGIEVADVDADKGRDGRGRCAPDPGQAGLNRGVLTAGPKATSASGEAKKRPGGLAVLGRQPERN